MKRSGDNNAGNGDERKKSQQLGAPTPAQVWQGMYDEDSSNLFGESIPHRHSSNDGARRRNPLSAPTLGQSVLEALQEQQDAMDTVRASNRNYRNNNNNDAPAAPARRRDSSNSSSSELQDLGGYGGSLEDLFKAPFAVASNPRNETVEFQEPGVIDFREALLAEQRQQQAILQERQRRFEEGAMQTEPRTATRSRGSSIDDTMGSSSPPRPPPKPILKTVANSATSKPAPEPSASPPPPPAIVRPKPLNSSLRVSSVPTVPIATLSNNRNNNIDSDNTSIQGKGASHQRTVSWSLEKLETISPNTSNDGDSHSNPRRPSLLSNRSASITRQGHRPRILTDDSGSILSGQRYGLRDVVGGIAPFESEAETNILRAVDEFMLAAAEDKNPSESLPFFHNLPEDFTLPLAAEEGESPAPPAVDNTSTGSGSPSTSNNRANSPHHQKKMSELSCGTATTSRQLRSNSIDGSNHENHPRMSPRPGTSMRKNPSVKKPSLTRPSLTRPRGHRHTQSVEQKLFGLTAQLSKLDGDALKNLMNDDYDDYNGVTRNAVNDNGPAELEAEPVERKGHRRIKTSAERLAERAQAVVQNAMQGRHGIQLHSASSSSIPHSDIESQQGNVDLATGYPIDTSSSSRKSRRNIMTPEPHTSMDGSNNKENHSTTIAEEGEEESSTGREEKEQPSSGGKKRRSNRTSMFGKGEVLVEGMREDWETFSDFLSPRKKSIWVFCKSIVLFVLLPSTAIATIFFYFVGNPKSLRADPDHDSADPNKATISWWILFIGVRQVLTLSLAIATQAFVIDFIVLGSRFSLRYLGPVVTLFLVQSKGWPFILFFWGLYDLGLLAGSSAFVRHWLYWQNIISMFNENNHSGTVLDNPKNYLAIWLAVGIGSVVSLKRLLVGLFLGRQTFVHHGEELAKVMAKMVLVSEVANLSRLPLQRSSASATKFDDAVSEWRNRDISVLMTEDEASMGTIGGPVRENSLRLPDLNGIGGNLEKAEGTDGKLSSDVLAATQADDQVPSVVSPGTSGTSLYKDSDRQLMLDALEQWEEPDRVGQGMDKRVSLASVLQFRKALTLLKRRYPFSVAFGPSDTREMCIESAQNVFDRLLLRDSMSDDDELNFDVLAVVAADSEGKIDEDMLRDLIKVFRPDRDGRLSRLAFVKSIDAVYKRLRLLGANVHNSSQIDIAIEKIINVGFYFVLGCIILACLGFQPLQLFFSLSSPILAFSFMVSTAAAQYFEGVLLILVQRPFGVGDRIHVSDPEIDVSPDGQAGWIVERVNLYNTTVCFGTTNERATVSNGTLARSRIINAARSPNAVVYVNLKFGIDVPYEKVQIFQAAVEAHVKDRPREWLGFLGFRAFAISVDLGFIQYTVVVQHREPWQNIVSILNSKARLTAYCHEVAKQLEMRYSSPPLPVDLNVYKARGQPLPPELQANPRDSVEKTA